MLSLSTPASGLSGILRRISGVELLVDGVGTPCPHEDLGSGTHLLTMEVSHDLPPRAFGHSGLR